MPSSDCPVWATIWVSPAALAGSRPPAMTSGRPPDSRNTIASSVSGSTMPPLLAAARSTCGRQAATRRAVAVTPPGLLAYRTWLYPAVARRIRSLSSPGE